MSRGKKVAVGAGIVALLGIALVVFRKGVVFFLLALLIRPRMDFDAAKVPPAPDYSKAESWAALPDKEDPSDWVPATLKEDPNPLHDQVDVFYIHPTGYFGRTWNAEMGQNSKPLGIQTAVMLASQASAFNGCGKVYAPEYRQATLYSFIEGERDPDACNGKRALELAYSDVASAFDYFIEHYNKDRPFILVGHSQGTCHALRLIAEKIDKTPACARMIAAYAVGFGVPKDYFEKVYTCVKPCESEKQAGCLITWDTLREAVIPTIGGFHYYPTGWEQAKGKARFCVNPLTWTSETARAPASANLGALLMDMQGDLGKLGASALSGIEKEQTWAEVHDGALWVKDLSGTPFDMIMSMDGNYHLFDFNLFWMNMRQNARVRAEAYLQAHAAPAVAATATETPKP